MVSSAPGTRRFIGRLAELGVLHERRRDLARRRGSVVLVGGPAGIGKSRLLDEFCGSIGGGRAPYLLRTECLEYGELAFEPIRSIIRDLPGGTAAEIDAAAEHAPERGAFFRSIERVILGAAAKRAVVIAIEDVHWADLATLEFLAFLAPRIATARVAIVLTYRNDEIAERVAIAAELAHLSRAATAHRIALQPLGQREMLDLIDSVCAPGARLTAKAVRSIIERAEGNPYYAEELTRGILDGDPPGSLPRPIEALARKRVAALAEDERTVLEHAAILGYRFDPELLRSILGAAPGVMERALRAACERNLLVEESHGPVRFRFRHALTHEAVLGRMLALDARPLHVRVARLLESRPEAPLGEIAFHWWKARDRERAAPANEAAGDAAVAVHAYGDAATYYERALSLETDRTTESRLCSKLATAATAQGDQSTAIGFFERALALELEAGRFSNAAEIVRRIAGRLVYAGRESEARERLDAFAHAYRPRLSEIDVLLVEGWPILIDLGGGGARHWLDQFERSSAPARATGKDAWGLLLLEVNARAAVGTVAAWRAARERLRAASLHRPAAERAFALLAFAVTAAYDGSDARLARDSIEEAIGFCGSHGLESLRKYADACDAFDRYLHGDLRGARDAARRALVDRDDLNQRRNMAVVGPLIGLALDDAELSMLAADAELTEALGSGHGSNSLALAAGGVALRLVSLGRDNEAANVLEQAVEALETTFGAQFFLPIAARYVTTARARERIEALVANLADDDESGHATRAMIRATFDARDRAGDRLQSARDAARRYRDLGWPLLEAQALELASDRTGARAIYLRCGSLRQVRRLSRREEKAATPTEAPAPLRALSAREREVALAAASGLSNAQIAERLRVSVKTVETHLSRTYARLGLRSRAQLASLVASDARREA